MNAPISWASRVETYLAYRRRHGFKLTIDATQLGSLLDSLTRLARKIT